MKFAILFCVFLTISAFDFDTENVLPSGDASASASQETVTKIVEVGPEAIQIVDNTTKSTTTTTATPAQKPFGREVSEIGVQKEDQKIEVMRTTTEKASPSTTTATTTLTTTAPTTMSKATPTTTTSSLPTKLEVVVTKSMFRLIDEAFRHRLINFESRIASLLAEREKIREDIETFDPAFDTPFFEGAFTTAAVEKR